jgi:transposase
MCLIDWILLTSWLNIKGGGTTAFPPKMILKVLFYSYLSNVYSCRKIAKALQENIYFFIQLANAVDLGQFYP